MQPEALVQLVGSGNTATVEDEWMRLVESPDITPAKLVGYQPVLTELCKTGKGSVAKALAWAAIETTSILWAHCDVLKVAGALLTSVPDSDELRSQVTALYRSAYGDREGLEALLAEAGLAGGRPVRRALRTLDVCLAVDEGDFLAARDDDGAARVDGIDRETWEYTIDSNQGDVTLGAVHLADRYERAESTDFVVMRHFAPDRLKERMSAEPIAVVTEICRGRQNSIDSDTLLELLVPGLFTEAEWKKWWTRARTALKKCPHIRLEGRAPYKITYTDVPIAYEEVLLAEFKRMRDPITRHEAVRKYVRECSSRGEAPNQPALVQCCEQLAAQARDLAKSSTATAAFASTAAWAVGEAAGIPDAGKDTVRLFENAPDLTATFELIRDETLLEFACTALVEVRPNDWCDRLIGLLPTFPQASCDKVAARLLDAGCPAADLEGVVQAIISSPVAHFEALLWLWDGPSNTDLTAGIAPVTLLTRILRALHDSRRSDDLPKQKIKAIATRGKSALSARGYERFDRCLEGIDSGMALALRTQIVQLENLGRVVREDLLTRLRPHLPTRGTQPAVVPWTRDDVLYVTETGMARKTKEIDHLVNVKMVENAKAIGLAAEKGDLSENSEYKFALEERDLLRARLAQMNSELQLARVIAPDTVPTDHVGIGVRVVFCRVEDGERYEMTFVGPWDADLDRGWYNYKAPLAQSVMGKRIDDLVEFDHSGAAGTYRIAELHNALGDAPEIRGVG